MAMKTLPNLGNERIAPWDIDDVNSSARSIKSAERTLALFELFSLHQRPLSIGEITTTLDIPQPSVTMLVRNLVKIGYLEHDRKSRTYVPTIRIMLLGSWVHRRMNHQGDLEAHLDQLLARVNETVIVAIQNGIYSQYVSAQLPDHPGRMEVQSGMLRPIARTAVGRVLLSQQTDPEIALIIRRYNSGVSPDQRYHLADFMQLIETIRRVGYAQTEGDMTSGLMAVAIAIAPPIGKIPLAVGVGGAIDSIQAKKSIIVDGLHNFRDAFAPADVKGRDMPSQQGTDA